MVFISIPVDSCEVTAFYDRLRGSYAHHFKEPRVRLFPEVATLIFILII